MSAAPCDYVRDFHVTCGIDAESALATLALPPISLHCWQGDDVGGTGRVIVPADL